MTPPAAGRHLFPIHVREWRKLRGFTVKALEMEIKARFSGEGPSNATLSRMERGLTPYDRTLLERIAAVLDTDPGSLLSVNPRRPPGPWARWSELTEDQRRAIMTVYESFLKGL